MTDFVIDDIALHLAASKNLDYRERVRQRFLVFANFLQENGLTTRVLLDLKVTTIPDNFKIIRSDLTDEGFAVVKSAYDKWLRGHDKGKPIEDVTPFQKAIAAGREACQVNPRKARKSKE
jgi:hypothetical protein